MSDNAPGSDPIRPADLRASDADREAVVALLQRAASEGRLTLGEFSERTEAVYSCLTQGELARITADLPVPQAAPAPQPAGRGDSPRKMVSIMGDNRERIGGPIPDTLRTIAVMGDLTVDLRDAILQQGTLTITGYVVMGSLKVVVPDGVEVHAGGSNVMGDTRTRLSQTASAPGGPVVRVQVTNVMGDVKVVDDTNHQKRSRFAHWWGRH